VGCLGTDVPHRNSDPGKGGPNANSTDRFVPDSLEEAYRHTEAALAEMNLLYQTNREDKAIAIDCLTKSNARFSLVLTTTTRNSRPCTRIHVGRSALPNAEDGSGDPVVVQVLDRIESRSRARQNEAAARQKAAVSGGVNEPGPSGKAALQEAKTGNAKAAIAYVQRLGGTVERKLDAAPDTVIGVDLHGTRVTDKDLEIMRSFPKLQKLNLYATPVTDAGMRSLDQLTGLQVLYLNATEVGDTGLACLCKLPALRELGLHRTRVTDEGLRPLQGLPSLEHLTLHGPGITDVGLAHLKGCKRLTYLVVSETAVTEAGIADLKRALPKLQVIR
jgi:hypothetical protein